MDNSSTRAPTSDDSNRDGATFELQQALEVWPKGKAANEIWSKSDYVRLCTYLNNGNTTCGITFLQRGIEPRYVMSKNKKPEDCITWTWDTICGKANRPLSFFPYSRNAAGMSNWGCLDFDEHDMEGPRDGHDGRARNWAIKAAEIGRRSNFEVILEQSGRGWHVWLISPTPLPCAEWVRTLTAIAGQIHAPIVSNICEIFPPSSEQSKCGKGVRAPGSWNPKTDTRGQIYWVSKGILPTGSLLVTDDATDIKRNNSFFSFSLKKDNPSTKEARLYKAWDQRWKKDFAITQPKTRHQKLEALVGHIFHQVGYSMAKRLAELQYKDKTVETTQTLPEHIEEFEGLWRGLDKFHGATTDPIEQRYLDGATQNQKDACRIIKSYARLAKANKADSFLIAKEDLANRLGVELSTVTRTVEKLVVLGVLLMTEPYRPNRRPALYAWLRPLSAATNVAEDYQI